MDVVINGEKTAVADSITVLELLDERKVKMPEMVSVEVNGEILDRETFENTQLGEGDQIEFMYFMGGGGGLWIADFGLRGHGKIEDHA